MMLHAQHDISWQAISEHLISGCMLLCDEYQYLQFYFKKTFLQGML